MDSDKARKTATGHSCGTLATSLKDSTTMTYKVRLSNIWIFIPLAVITTFSVIFSLAFLLHDQFDRIIIGLIALPFMALTFIISAVLSSRLRIIEIKDDLLIIDNGKRFKIRNIDHYFENSNFLFDGLKLKTKEGDTFQLTNLLLFNKSDDFKLLKERLLKRDSNIIGLPTIARKGLSDYKYLNILGWVKLLVILAANIFWIIETNNLLSKIVVVLLSLTILGLILTKKK